MCNSYIEVDRLRAALMLIGTTCESFTSGSCVRDRNLFASYGADKWCHGCIAASALGLNPDRSKRRDTLNFVDEVIATRQDES